MQRHTVELLVCGIDAPINTKEEEKEEEEENCLSVEQNRKRKSVPWEKYKHLFWCTSHMLLCNVVDKTKMAKMIN